MIFICVLLVFFGYAWRPSLGTGVSKSQGKRPNSSIISELFKPSIAMYANLMLVYIIQRYPRVQISSKRSGYVRMFTLRPECADLAWATVS
ncbi:hypothetical protein DFH29DRAFT_25201 [Suillus ampliporus]|nr:hypothetical protein DFH29DRAFT_25201 [Suillus ampliporus]